MTFSIIRSDNLKSLVCWYADLITDIPYVWIAITTAIGIPPLTSKKPKTQNQQTPKNPKTYPKTQNQKILPKFYPKNWCIWDLNSHEIYLFLKEFCAKMLLGRGDFIHLFFFIFANSDIRHMKISGNFGIKASIQQNNHQCACVCTNLEKYVDATV